MPAPLSVGDSAVNVVFARSVDASQAPSATTGACLRGAMITTSKRNTNIARHCPRQARAVADDFIAYISVLVMIIAPRRQAHVVANENDRNRLMSLGSSRFPPENSDVNSSLGSRISLGLGQSPQRRLRITHADLVFPEPPEPAKHCPALLARQHESAIIDARYCRVSLRQRS